MPGILVLLICFGAIKVLLRIERTVNPSASWLVWLPTIWTMICSSRAIARWFTPWDTAGSVDYEAGSFWDRWVFIILTVVVLVIVTKRDTIDWSRVWKGNWGVLLFFGYIGLSVLWSDYPFVSTKRWIRSAGVVIMGLAILSEVDPLKAVESLYRRAAYILIPLSFVLIRYFPLYGRVYGRWDGIEMWTGVAQHKNTLGILCAGSIFWIGTSLLRRFSSGEPPVPGQTRADLSILVLSIYLLLGPGKGAYSATSLLITVVGFAIYIPLHFLPKVAGVLVRNLKTAIISTAVLAITLGSSLMGNVSSMLGRREDLTGRATDIWPAVLAEAARHPLLGAGYGNAWGLGGILSRLTEVEEAHNGYLDTYLQLGIVGCLLLFVFFMTCCTRIKEVFPYDRGAALTAMCFLAMILVYNWSETAFFDLYISTIMVLVPMALSGKPDDSQTHTKQNLATDHAWSAARVCAQQKPA